jgi:hypothetical protein
MCTTSVSYRQIYPFLLHHRQFPNPASLYPGYSGRACPTRPEIEAGLAGLLRPLPPVLMRRKTQGGLHVFFLTESPVVAKRVGNRRQK